MISTRHLVVFQAVAREGTLGGAAQVLGCTQPTVSHHLAALESELGTTLVRRQSRGVALTDRGRVLLGHADRILSELTVAERDVRDHAQLRAGRLRIGVFASACTAMLPPLIARFRREHPGVRVLVVEEDDPEVTVAHVRTGRLDLGLLYREPAEWARMLPGVVVPRLFVDPLHIALAPDHPLARRRTRLKFAELADAQWVTARSDDDPLHRVLVDCCRSAGFEPRIALRSDTFATIGSFVAAGLAVALVPELSLPSLGAGVAIMPLGDDPPARSIHAVALADGASLTATAFMRLLQAER